MNTPFQEQAMNGKVTWDWSFLGIASISLFVETVLLLAVYRSPGWAWRLCALHALLSTALIVWAWMAPAAGRDQRYPWLLALFTLLAGPVGAGGALFSMLLGFAYSRQSTSFENWYASLFPEQDDRMPQMLAESIARKGTAVAEPEVTPFSEVFAFGTKEEKLEALVRMTRKFKPAFAPLLKMALNDPINTVRVQAAAAISKIESDFLAESGRLTERSSHRPEVPELLLESARHYDDYAFIGLLDLLREQDNRARALRLYIEYLRQVPADEQARLSVGRILMRQGEYRQAANWFEECNSAGLASPQVALWQMEALARLGRYSDVRKLAREHRRELADDTEYPAEIVGAVRLWSGESFSTAEGRVS
jgi:polysaccharide biosynthesis protein PelE